LASDDEATPGSFCLLLRALQIVSISFGRKRRLDGGKAAALLPHSKTWRKEAVPDNHMDNSKETITIRDKHG